MVNKPKYQKFKPESAIKLYRIADNDLYAAEFMMTAEKIRPELIIYQIQQAVEKSIKAVIIFNGKPVPLTHDIDILMSELDQSEQEKLPQGASELTQFASIKRYTEGDEVFEKKDVESALQIGKFFLAWSKNIIN